MVTLYGLKNCDTCRAARTYLKERDFQHEFRDVRADGFSDEELDAWLSAAGWEKLVNKSSKTWRALRETDKADLDAVKARRLLKDNPTLIKRPVIDAGRGVITVGWDKDVRGALQSAL